MDNIIEETNRKLEEIVSDLNANKDKYQVRYNEISQEINEKLDKVKQYKEEYYSSKKKIDNLNSDIEEFKEEYQNLVNKFKDDELSNILVGANKEISAKINDRKLKIQRDTDEMNKLVSEAEKIKEELVKLNAQKKALEILLNRSMDIAKYYEKLLNNVVSYSEEHPTDLCSYFKLENKKEEKQDKKETKEEKKTDKKKSNKISSENFDFDSITNNIVNF